MGVKEALKNFGLATGLGIAGAAIGEAAGAGIGALVSRPRLEVEIGLAPEEELKGRGRRWRRVFRFRRWRPRKKKLYYLASMITKWVLGGVMYYGGTKVRGFGGDALKAMGLGATISSGTDIVRMIAKDKRLEDLTLELVGEALEGAPAELEVEVEETAKTEEAKAVAEAVAEESGLEIEEVI